MNEEEKENVKNWFDSLSDASRDYDKEFDSKITYIGAGAIALSIAFAADMETSGVQLYYFMAGEIAMTTAVVCNLLSFPLSKFLVRRYHNILAKYIKMGYKGELKPDIETQEKRIYRSIFWWNLSCFIIFVGGVVCTCIYVFQSLNI